MTASDTHSLASAPPEPRRFSGRVVVAGFLAFTIIGAAAAILLAHQVRPQTMAARARVMPLSGEVELSCLEPGQAPADVRLHPSCSTAGHLRFSLSKPGFGIQSMSYVLLSPDPKETLISGQFPPKGSGEVALRSATPDTHLAVFIYADEPLSLAKLMAAIKQAPAGDVPDEIKAIEQHLAGVMHADPKHLHEVRTARVEMKIVR